MTFTTVTFLIFLLVFGMLYWSCRRRPVQNLLIVGFSYLFYAWWDWRFCGLMFLSTMTDFFVAQAVARCRSPVRRRMLVGLSLTMSLGILGWFKYFNFFAESLQALAAELGWVMSPVTLQIVLPVGISFYTFQTLSYTIDVYRGQLLPARNAVEYLAFVSFFPQLVAGPIERATHLLPQFQRDRVFDAVEATDGFRLILWGAFKKLVVADNLAPIVDGVFGRPGEFSGPWAVIGIVGFAFQIYCDFSAYSDMARGLAKCFGFDLMRNFNRPYFSRSMGEFWRRWHVSLSSWFRDYVYIPLGGSRVARPRQVVNLLVTFVISGLWHGASWNFVVWGAFNGLLVVSESWWSGSRGVDLSGLPGGPGRWPSLRVFGEMLRTFLLVCVGWVFFRAVTFDAALAMLVDCGHGWLDGQTWSLADSFWRMSPVNTRAGWFILFVVLAEWTTRGYEHPLAALAALRRWQRWLIYSALLWWMVGWGSANTGQFIYFQF